MQYQQVCIAADQEIGLGDQRQGQENVVFGVAASRSYLQNSGILHYEQVRSSAQIGNEFLAFFPIEVAIELAAVDHFLYLSQCFGTGTEFREVEGFQQRLVRRGPNAQRRPDQSA
jgi:hypothetical protein